MAFITKNGGRFTVRQGVTGKRIATFSSRKSAVKKRDQLHKTLKPKAANRGKAARKRFNKRKKK